MGFAYVIGTWDTKDQELEFIAGELERSGAKVLRLDASTQGRGSGVDIGPEQVADAHPQGRSAVLELKDRGEAIAAMSVALEHFLAARQDLAGVIAAGGTGNTALVAPAMRALPIGVPKVLVSTVASGNVAPYVGAADMTLVYSVTDVQGINRISRRVLGNAARALAGMVAARSEDQAGADKPAVGLTMFGVTTPCVQAVTKALGDDYDCLVFHATGTGGQSMEKLMQSSLLSGVIDITTTEIADLLVGGVFAATEARLDVIAETRIPYVGSCGALDMVNFGARPTVPPRFEDRKFHIHNPQVTLMRTTVDENRKIGEFLARKLNACQGPVRFLIPEKGVSLIDVPGMPFHDPEADAALFETIEAQLKPGPMRRLEKLPYAINEPAFSDALVAAFHDVMKARS